MSAEPYLSVVAVSRNDDHGGDLLRRMQLFVSGWLEQCRRHRLPAELVLVEWNPPPDRPPLAKALAWPADTGPCDVRIVTVPPEIHRRYRHSRELPLFQMIGKNVGIRRARAPFVLATNIDILFNDELVAFLAARRLEPDQLYRIDRSDVASEVSSEAGIARQLAYCRTHLLRVNGREATFVPGGDREAADAAGGGAGIRFGEGFGAERTASGGTVQAAGAEAVLHAGSRRGVLRLLVDAGPNPGREPLVLRLRDAAGHAVSSLRFRDLQRLYVPLSDTSEGDRLLRLAVDTPGTRRHGPRELNVRVLECSWATAEELLHEGVEPSGPPRAVPVRDVYPAESGIALLDGWGERSWSDTGRLFRRIESGAGFAVYSSRRLPGELVLDVEADEPMRLELRGEGVAPMNTTLDGSRRLILSTPFHGRAAEVRILLETKALGRTGSVRVHALRRAGLGSWLRQVERKLRPRLDYLHTNGCGDFTLMHRDRWFRLRGYPEWEAYSMGIDGFLCYAAHADGATEVVLREPKRIYHIEHAVGSGWSPQGERQLYERITSKGIAWIPRRRILGLARRMYRDGPPVTNAESWGLGDEPLTETRPELVRAPVSARKG